MTKLLQKRIKILLCKFSIEWATCTTLPCYLLLATRWLRILSVPPNDKIRNRLVANPILREDDATPICISVTIQKSKLEETFSTKFLDLKYSQSAWNFLAPEFLDLTDIV